MKNNKGILFAVVALLISFGVQGQNNCPQAPAVTTTGNYPASITFTRVSDGRDVIVRVPAAGLDTLFPAELSYLTVSGRFNSNTTYYGTSQALCGDTAVSDERAFQFTTSCGAVVHVPWNVNFGQSAARNCWDVSQYTSATRRWMYYSGAMRSRSGYHAAGADGDYLISPLFSLPDTVGLYLEWKYFTQNYSAAAPTTVEVRVATCTENGAVTGTWTTLRTLTDNYSQYTTLRVSLDDYAGQNVKVAFVRSVADEGNAYVKDVVLDANPLPSVEMEWPTYAYVDEPLTLVPTLASGVTTGLSYTWHSSLLDSTWTGDSLTITYPVSGYDTVTIVASNIAGSDTVTGVIDVVDCRMVTDLPWNESFVHGFACWTQTGSDNAWTYDTWGNGNEGAMHAHPASGMGWATKKIVSQPIAIPTDAYGLRVGWWMRSANDVNSSYWRKLAVTVQSLDSGVLTEDTVFYMEGTQFPNSYYDRFDADLSAFAGQTVNIGFVAGFNDSQGNLWIDDIEVRYFRDPVISLTAPQYTCVGDTLEAMVTLTEGDTAGLTYTWHSSLLDSTMVAMGDRCVIVYSGGGTDTMVVTATNLYGTMSDTAIIEVCPGVATFPWTEQFADGYEPCWTVDGFSRRTGNYGVQSEEGNYNYYAQMMWTNTAGATLLSPPVVVPADATKLALRVEFWGALQLWVSPTASRDTALYTDLLLDEPYLYARMKNRWFNLSAYAGQTIRVGLLLDENSRLEVARVAVEYDTLPVLSTIFMQVPTKTLTDSATLCTVRLHHGSADGLTYTWHSSLLDSTWTGDSVLISYLFGGDDTLTVVATNAYGSDTLSKVLHVVDCTPVTALPWKETFADGLVCWYKPEGSRWIDAIPYDNSSFEYLRHLYLQTRYDTLGSWIMSKEINIPADTDMVPRLFWKVASSNKNYQHLYSVLVTTDGDYTDTANYTTLYVDSATHINFSNYDLRSIDLTPYAGQSIHVAFHNHAWHMPSSSTGLYIDDVEVRTTAVPRITLAADNNTYYYGDTARFTATLTEGSMSGLTYTWHSTLLDSTFTSNTSHLTLNYGLLYGQDTVSVVATNAYGSDTASVVVMSQIINQPVAYLSIIEKSPHMRVDKAEVGDTVVYVVTRNRCVTTGMFYSLHSTLEDTTITVATTADTCYFPLLYTNEGIDSITVTVSNTYSYGQDSVRMNIYNCPVATVPFLEDFDEMGGTGYLTCWPGYWWLQSRGGSNYAVRLSGSAIHQALISPAIDLPADSIGLQLSWYAQFTSNATPNVPIRIMVSPTGSAHIADFTEVLYDRTMPNYSYDSVSLDAYRGQRVRLAFYFDGYYGLFDDIKIDYDRSAPQLTVSGPTTATTLVDIVYTANVTAGSPRGLTYSWRSSMVDGGLAQFRVQDSKFIVNYSTSGTDTLRCIATNDYGADTQTVVVPVSGCGYQPLPYSENFNSTAVGSMPDCWTSIWHKAPSTAPKVVAPGSYYFSPDNTNLLFLASAVNSSYYDTAAITLLPAFDEPVSSLQLSLWYAYEDTTKGTLSAGYIENGQFVPVADLPVVGHGGRYDTIVFSSAPASASRIALCWKQMVTSTWYSASIDNVEVVTAALPHDVVQLTVDDSTATEIALDGPATVYALDTNLYTALVTSGPDSALTYTWHSSMAARGLAQCSILNSTFNINYTFTGIDTVWLTVSNGIDTGTAYRVVTVTAPLQVAISGSNRVVSGEAQTYQALVTLGSPNGVSYSWHSTLLDSTLAVNANAITLDYANLSGVDTLTVTATSPFTTHSACFIVTVYNCNISTFPASEGFETDNCWITVNNTPGYGWTRSNSTRRRSGSWCMEAVYPTHGDPADDWLISPAIDLPAGGTVTMVYRRFFQESEPFNRNYEPRVQLRVSTSNRADTTLFTDTVPITYIGMNGNFWKAYSVSLADYQGQTIYIAFRNLETVHPGGYSSMEWHLAIDDLQFTVDQVPVLDLHTDEVYYTCDTAVATVGINHYDSLQYDIRWHSSMADRGLATLQPFGDSLRIVYLSGGRDTISVAVSNAYGTDSVWRSAEVHQCDVVSDFPHVFRPVTDDAEWGCWKRWNLCPDVYGGWGRNYDYYNHGSGSYLCIMSKASHNSNYNPDQWLVSPYIALPANAQTITLHWHGFCEETTFNLQISTTGRDSVAQFSTILYTQTNGSLYTPRMQDHWSYYTVDLSAYRGHTVSLAFRNVGPVHYPYGYVALDTMWVECTLDTTPPPPDTVWRTVTVLCDSAMGTVTGAGRYPDSSVVSLEAIPAEGYRFVGWSMTPGYANLVTDNPLTFTVTADVTVTAHFEPLPPDTVWRTVTVLCDSAMGTISGGGRYADSSVVSLEAIPAEGYRFVGWSMTPGYANLVTDNPLTFTVIADVTVTAHFEPLPPDTVWRSLAVLTNISGICETYGSGRYTDSSTVEIGFVMLDTATEGGYWQFLGWDDGPMANPRNILLTSDSSVTALFQWIEDTIGIEEIQNSKFEIKIYPNPATSDVTIELINPSAHSNDNAITVAVIDMQGRTVVAAMPVNSSILIPRSSLAPGAYFVRCTGPSGTSVTKLIVK